MPDSVFGLCELLHTTPFAFSSVGQKRDRGPMLDVFPQQKCNRLLDCEQISLISEYHSIATLAELALPLSSGASKPERALGASSIGY